MSTQAGFDAGFEKFVEMFIDGKGNFLFSN
jgi:hypothetical protein